MCQSVVVGIPRASHVVAFVAPRPLSDNVTVDAWIRWDNLKSVLCTYIVALSNNNILYADVYVNEVTDLSIQQMDEILKDNPAVQSNQYQQ